MISPIILYDLVGVVLNLATSASLAFFIRKVRPDLFYYFLFNLSIALWSSLYIPWLLTSNASSFSVIAQLLMVSIILIPFIFLNFCYEITQTKPHGMVKLYNIAGFIGFSVLAFTPFLIKQIYTPALGFHFWPLAGDFFWGYLCYFGINFVLGHIILYTKRTDQKVNYITLGTFLAFIGGSTNFFLWFGIEIPPIGNALVSIYVILILFAVTKHELLNVQIVIGRTVAFFLTVLIYTTLYLALLLPYRAYISTETDIPFIIGSVLLGTFVGLTFERVRLFIQTSAYKKFLKLKYNFEDTLKTVSEKLMVAHSKEQVLEAFLAMQESLEIGDCYAMLRHGDTDEFDIFRFNKLAAENNELSDVLFTVQTSEAGASLVGLFSNTASKLLRYEALPERVQHSLISLNIHKKSVFLAVHSFRQLQAIFIIGQRLSEESYSGEDLSLFEVVLNQAITVFERIDQTRKLLKSNRETEHLNTQLQAVNKELEVKVEAAIALAQKHFHQAALSSLSTGIAHEIRNPMAAMMSSAQYLGSAYHGRPSTATSARSRIRPSSQEKNNTGTWSCPITTQDFLCPAHTSIEKAEAIFNRLTQLQVITQAGDLVPTQTLIEMGPEFDPDIPFIQARLEQLQLKQKLFGFITVVCTQIPRILTITDNMMRYGVSGGGVKKDTFVQIEGITEQDSETLYKALIEHGFLDEKGCVLDRFKNKQPDFPSKFSAIIPESVRSKTSLIMALIEQTPGAVKKNMDIRDSLKSALSILEGDCRKKDIVLQVHFSEDLPLIAGDEHRLQQAFFNILFNAVQAMEQKPLPQGHHTLSVSIKEHPFLDRSGNTIEGIEIAIQDTGNGIPESAKKKIFDPFFTTKGVTGGKNVGLGLSILQEVILNHNGVIDIDSEVGVGTTFKVYLPTLSITS